LGEVITSNFSLSHMSVTGKGEEVMGENMIRWARLAFQFLSHKVLRF